MSGMAVIETSVPLGSLPSSGTVKAVVTSSNATSGQDATAPFSIAIAEAPATPIRPIPLSPWLALPLALMIFGVTAWWHRRHPGQTGLVVLALFAVGSGLVWAATVLRDGSVGDWGGIAAAVINRQGNRHTGYRGRALQNGSGHWMRNLGRQQVGGGEWGNG